MKNLNICILFLGVFLLGACKKFVEIDAPVTTPSSGSIYETDGTAIAVLNGIYSQMFVSSITGGLESITTLTGLTGDELQNYSTTVTLQQAYSNSLSSTMPSVVTSNLWKPLYQLVYYTNAAIEGIEKSEKISSSTRRQLMGEAKFLRAYLYFNLVNLYKNVPLLLTTDYRINSKPTRSSSTDIYNQMIKDLMEAQAMLGNNYIALDGVASTSERIRPNKAAATALLARIYLYNRNWAAAEVEANQVIANPLFSLSGNLNDVFKKNSSEAIWQLQSVVPTRNTADAITYILTTEPGVLSSSFALNDNLVFSFETGDARRANWIKGFISGAKTYYYPFKYQVTSAAPAQEYQMMLRLAETYLIRAEARVRLDKLTEARNDLNTIRRRASLSDLPVTITKDQLILAIEEERRHELFMEMGHRWFDLKRTERIDAVMSVITPQKGGSWNTNKQLFPIPQSELILNSNLVQNPGY